LAMRASSAIWSELKITNPLPPALLLLHPTIQDIEQFIDTQKNEDPRDIAQKIADDLVPLEKEMTELEFSPAPDAGSKTKVILLTGVTGHLGVWLLRSLLVRGPYNVVCIVRAESDLAAAKRLSDYVMDVLPKPSPMNLIQTIRMFKTRIKVMRGDLNNENFGLSEGDRASLASMHVVAVLHNAAEVHWLKPYQALYKTNVASTAKLLSFAAKVGASFHYVSSLSTQWDYSRQGKEAPEEPLAAIPSGMSGYFDTKWAGEKLTVAARKSGMPTFVYRPSFVIGATETGKCNAEDFICRTLSSLADLHLAPEHLRDLAVDVVPVDYVAECIAHIALNCKSSGASVNICGSSMPLSTLVQGVVALGYPVKFTSQEHWESEVGKTVLTPKPTAIAPLVPMLRTLPKTKRITGTSDLSKKLCSDTKTVSSVVGEKLFCLMVEWLVAKGYMKPPPKGLRRRRNYWLWIPLMVLLLSIIVAYFLW